LKKDAVIEAMIKEVDLFTKNYENDLRHAGTVETIYFGGGTPSLLTAEEIKKLIDAVNSHFLVDKDAEITLEANPDDITPNNLYAFKNAGINRLSLGVQSFIERNLVWMNRAHNAQQALQSIHLVKDAGFKNFSVDLIYGTPGLDSADWEENLTTVIGLDIPHLSCYALTVEPNTPLKKMISLKKKEDVDTDIQSNQFLLMADMLEEAGYEHYEISNFAVPGARSKHNSGYWLGKNYFGFGPSAHSFHGNKRFWNVSNNDQYLKSISENIIPYSQEDLTPTQRLNEYIMTSVRTSEGLDLNLFSEKFGKGTTGKLYEMMYKLQKEGKAKIHNSIIILTKEGKLFADGIAADLFFEEKDLVS
jgi:oxygen-independent coproporphyrinogen-3 oxidase